MDDNEQRALVRQRYGDIAAAEHSCCGPSSAPSSEEMSKRMGYTDADLAAVPNGANLGLGCGNPQAIGELRPGEVVVDLGSGAGFDCFLAARQIGPEGRAIGVDMTHEMLAKARRNAVTMGLSNVEFRLGEIEHLPIADNTADVVISNCVVNLSPDKPQVFREAFRVLKPGGRLAISDVVNFSPLPSSLAGDEAMLCGCIAGAAQSDEIETWLRGAGFEDARVEIKPESRDLIKDWAPGQGVENHVVSAMFLARKPLTGLAEADAPAACCPPSSARSSCGCGEAVETEKTA